MIKWIIVFNFVQCLSVASFKLIYFLKVCIYIE